ncbi:condensation domain-containing protein [Streptomyces bacillaris]|uniref:condensation domain-containing protein n=1 Tax=Streptomyces bacillaris TaxID=68179 RepID=UPI00363B92BC
MADGPARSWCAAYGGCVCGHRLHGADGTRAVPSAALAVRRLALAVRPLVVIGPGPLGAPAALALAALAQAEVLPVVALGRAAAWPPTAPYLLLGGLGPTGTEPAGLALRAADVIVWADGPAEARTCVPAMVDPHPAHHRGAGVDRTDWWADITSWRLLRRKNGAAAVSTGAADEGVHGGTGPPTVRPTAARRGPGAAALYSVPRPGPPGHPIDRHPSPPGVRPAPAPLLPASGTTAGRLEPDGSSALPSRPGGPSADPPRPRKRATTMPTLPPSLADLIETAARTHPEAVAVEESGHLLGYGDLLTGARAVAADITAARVRAVAVTGERGAALVTAVVAAVLADVRLVLVDPVLPEARRASMIRQSGAELLLTAGAGGTGVSFERLPAEAPGGASAGTSTGEVLPGYVFFTSGTTSTPKAVDGRWSGIAHFTRWQRDTFGIGPGDRFAQLTGVSFDVVLRDVFTPLISGATLCVPPTDTATAPGGVPGWLTAAGITVVHTVPSLAARWTAAARAETGADDALRLTFFAGEPLPAAAVTGWRERFGGTRVINLYGPTETTLAKFWQDVTEPGPGVQPVGEPLPGTRAALVDGEVWISTPYATRGYLDAAATADRFVAALPDTGVEAVIGEGAAEGAAGDAPWYRTGDLGRLGDDRALHLLGRSDFQVKIDGNRVEPEGIAALLREHPAVRNAVVVAHRRSDGAVRLVGHYAADPGAGAEPLVRQWAGERLPAAHVPSTLVRHDELPLNANGKVDRAALPVPGADDGAGSGAEEEAARDALTRTAVEVFRAVLPDAPDRADSDFFQYGGTSLDAADLSVRLLDATGRRLEMSEVYTLRTPRAMADALRGRPLDSQGGIPRGTHPDRTGLSPQQRRYRNVYLPRVNRSWSNMPALFALPDATDAPALERALRTVLDRHESLRARFTEAADSEAAPGAPRPLHQHFVPTAELALDIATVDLRTLPDAEQSARMEELRIEGANTPIGIDHAPLFRTTLLLHHGDRATLLWNVHHMVSDGYSQRLLHQELTLLLTGAERELPELPIGYRDYIAWRERLATDPEALAPHRRYWQQVFTEPYERPLLPVRDGVADAARGIAHQFPVPDDLRAEVAAFCRDRGTTPFSVYFAAYTLMAHDLYRREDLVIGTPAAGRTRPEFSNLVGNFISLVGIRARRGEAETFATLVRTLQDRTVLAMEHQDYQYDEVMADIGAEPDDDRFPLTTVFISLVEAPADQAAALRAPAHRDLGCEVKFDLMGYLRRAGEMVALDLHTRQGLLSPERLETLAASFLDHLRAGLKEN